MQQIEAVQETDRWKKKRQIRITNRELIEKQIQLERDFLEKITGSPQMMRNTSKKSINVN